MELKYSIKSTSGPPGLAPTRGPIGTERIHNSHSFCFVYYVNDVLITGLCPPSVSPESTNLPEGSAPAHKS